MFFASIAALAAFVSISSILLWVTSFGSNRSEARLEELGRRPQKTPMEAPFNERVIIPVLDGFVTFVIGLLPHAFVERTDRLLLVAGRPMSTQAFFTLAILTGLVLPGGLLLLLLLTMGQLTQTLLLALAGLVILGILAPFILLRRRARARKLAIRKSLADAIDLVTVSVEAGLGLDGAFHHVAQKLNTPLADEFALMLREVALGRPRKEALIDMADRTDLPEVVTFVGAVIQSEQLGTSVGRVLRTQSTVIRTRRRQRAEEFARKAPVKMIFPLVLCVMPSFFIVVLGPTFVRLANYLGE